MGFAARHHGGVMKKIQIRKTTVPREPAPLDLRTPSGRRLPY